MIQLKANLNYQMTDHTSDREDFENQYYQLESRFNELLLPVVETIRFRQLSKKQFIREQQQHSQITCDFIH